MIIFLSNLLILCCLFFYHSTSPWPSFVSRQLEFYSSNKSNLGKTCRSKLEKGTNLRVLHTNICITPPWTCTYESSLLHTLLNGVYTCNEGNIIVSIMEEMVQKVGKMTENASTDSNGVTSFGRGRKDWCRTEKNRG
jgi:hypothetical protein